MSPQGLNKSVLIGTVGGLVGELIRSNVVKEVYDVPGAIEMVADALVKAADKLDPAAPAEPPKPETEF